MFSYISNRQFHLSEVINGAFAGMAGMRECVRESTRTHILWHLIVQLINASITGITPGAGFMVPQWSLLVGFVVGTGSYFSSWFLQNRVQLDDVLDVTSLQGVPGILGALMAACCASNDFNPSVANGAFYGNPILLLYQVLGISVCIAWSGFWTALLVLLYVG
jgi:ammonia channel protein AmtB